ncbi:TPA: AAA family ATPase [Enterococcus faecium]
MENFSLTENRTFSRLEKQMIWKKPKSHRTSAEEWRIASEIKGNWQDPEMKISNVLLEGDAGSGKTQLAKALSADLQLPYTKVTCFADMDKSDVFGALLPVVDSNKEQDQELLEAIYQTDTLEAVLTLIQNHYGIDPFSAKEKLAELVQRIEADYPDAIHYSYYPSEIVRAIEKGYLLEIQEPTVIRDASVLVALNSALEPNGMLNLPTGIIRRHPDCVIVITTNRNYQGNRPLNESLRDRMQHAEKMDLPALEVMAERAMAKTMIQKQELLLKMAEIIRLLDETAKANAIKGVAGMRSYFYWANTYKQGQDLLQSIYPKVLYKLSTDSDELAILEQALSDSGLLLELQDILRKEKWGHPQSEHTKERTISAEEANERNITENAEEILRLDEKKSLSAEEPNEGEEKQEETIEKNEIPPQMQKERSSDIEGKNQKEQQTGDDSQEMSASDMEAHDKEIKKQLNKEARQIMKETIHEKEGLIVHRPAFQGKYEGQRFNASKVAYGDLRNFDKKNPPHEQPSLAVAVRIDESGSMIRDDRIEAAKKAAIAIAEFSKKVDIPLLIYGDTADRSSREKTSLFSYKEFEDGFQWLNEKLVTMKPRQNNRDGAALRLAAEKLNRQSATTKLLLNISDGQPKALPDYTGKKAKEDIQSVLKEYERQGILFVSAAIGQDKEEIKSIYGESRFVDITDLNEFPKQMIQLIARYL